MAVVVMAGDGEMMVRRWRWRRLWWGFWWGWIGVERRRQNGGGGGHSGSAGTYGWGTDGWGTAQECWCWQEGWRRVEGVGGKRSAADGLTDEEGRPCHVCTPQGHGGPQGCINDLWRKRQAVVVDLDILRRNAYSQREELDLIHWR